MITKEMAQVAAKWWADCLREPTFQTLSGEERSDPASEPAAFAEMLATISARDPGADAADKFEAMLCEALLSMDTSGCGFSFGVDYWPDAILRDALKSAGLPVEITSLPWKTRMHIADGQISAARGYRNPSRQIWPIAESKEQP